MTHDAELDALAEQLCAAGLLTITTDDAGAVTYTLTPEGERMAQQIALSGSDDALDALLEGSRFGP